ncbi:hypothetical protein ID866_10676 [Astraeus odoratus]|nr:hypothetical protein ID866_10676 [Astraeus odoratus]
MAPLILPAVESLNECPRFRILVIGKTGVGKTLLINRAFGITTAVKWPKLPSDDHRGEPDIEQPLISADGRFVLHDSNVFDQDEGQKLAAVESFIKRHKNQTDVGSQLHAVW